MVVRTIVVHRCVASEHAMADFDQNSAESLVFTFKEGLLSAVAHDLRIKVTRFTLAVDAGDGGDVAGGPRVEARWDAGSLVVDSVMRDGRENPGALGQRDLDKIARTIREDVLQSARHPAITFRSERVELAAERARIEGALTLCGRTRTIAIEAKKDGARWVAEATLHQPDYGIKPYSAMLGTLKIKPDVKVRVSVAADAIAAIVGPQGG